MPAHNEEAGLARALDALLSQTRPPDAVVVVADRCSDSTEDVALAYPGVGVFRTQGNRARKAGALNQALSAIEADLEEDDAVLVLDADSILAPEFIASALPYLTDGHAAVGGNFRGEPGGGYLGMCQRNEYARYARDVARLQGRCLVLTGTATVFRFAALAHVRAERGESLPGATGAFYDTEVLTEDNEMTFALRTLGYRVISPKGCTLTTEVMATWRALARQRLRWKRGAFENLRQYGFNKLTAPYWGRQVLSAFGVLVTLLYLASLLYGALAGYHFQPAWMAVSAVFVAERALTAHERGWRMMLVGALLVPEMIYDLFLQGVQALAYASALAGRRRDGRCITTVQRWQRPQESPRFPTRASASRGVFSRASPCSRPVLRCGESLRVVRRRCMIVRFRPLEPPSGGRSA